MKKVFFLVLLLIIFSGLNAQEYEEIFTDQVEGEVSAVDWVDLNNDGFLELVIIENQELESTMKVFENQEGQLVPAPFENTIYPESIVDFADFNNDNIIDLVVIDTSKTEIWYNEGNFQFEKMRLTSDFIGKPVLADLDNNGFKDIFFSNENGAPQLWMNNKDNWQNISGDLDSTLNIHKLADFNKDGITDVLANREGVTSIILRQSIGDFDSIFYSSDMAIKNPVVADLNADGWLDFAGFSQINDSWNLVVFYNKFPSANFQTDTLQEIANPYFLFAADVTYDGYLDLIIIEKETDISYTTFFLPYQPEAPYSVKEPLMTGKVVLGDYDADNDLDLAVVDGTKISVYQCNQVANQQPFPPDELFAFNNGESVDFMWDNGKDDSTPAVALTYNLLLYSDAPILTTAFEASNNVLSIVKFGNQSLANTWQLNGVEEGRYFYDVIPVDNSYVPSYFEGPECGDDGCICDTRRCFTFAVNRNNQQYVCYGDTVIVDLASGEEVTWYSQRLGKLGSQNPLTYVAYADDILYTNFTNEQGCTETFSLPVFLKSTTKTNRTYDTTFCENEEILLSSLNNENLTRWYSLKNTSWSQEEAFVASEADTLILEMQDTYECVHYDTINVSISPNPEVTTSGAQTINAGQQVQISASGGVSYQWEPAEGLNNPNISNPLASPSKTTNYQVKVTNQNGCFAYGSVLITVNQQVFVPNLFSPNGDGKNDVFKIYGDGVAEIFLQIRDRDGNVVFETNNPQVAFNQGWNGTFNNRNLPPGNYYWTLSGLFADGGKVITENENSGIVTLIR